MLFRQLFDHKSSTYTYLLADDEAGEAVLIDPVFENVERDLALLRELELKLLLSLETHVHADHITAAWLLKQRCGSRIGLAENGGAKGVDRLLRHGDRIDFGKLHVEVRATPGHTSGCLTYVTGDQTMAFTGDALLIRGAGRTDFQQGDARQLFQSVKKQIFSLPDATLIYPGHDYSGRTVTTVAEEKHLNPRLGGQRSEDDFVGFMTNLKLPHPKQLAAALPANLNCGRTEAAEATLEAPSWAPIVRTFAGVPELEAGWVAEHRDILKLVDVRQPAELQGELGHIPNVEAIALEGIQEATETWDRSSNIVTVCRSGGRSAQAAILLEKAGFKQVANLTGGMIRWRDEGHEVIGGSEE